MKGKNSFGPWQAAKQDGRAELIAECLLAIKKRRKSFKYITDLAEEVADFVAGKEGATKKCNRSTLLRNGRYKSLLLSHMADQSAIGTATIVRDSITDPAAKALLLTAEISIENLARENVRLKQYIASIASAKSDENESTVKRIGGRGAAAKVGARSEDINADRVRYLATCEALKTILLKFGGIVAIDLQTLRILDLTEMPHQVLVDERIGGPFFEWLKQNPIF